MSSKKDNKNLDETLMKLALSLAKENEGLTKENPSVGCVIARKDEIISTGVTSYGGRPHAEVNAINNIKGNHNNLTAYITMEPCSHYGKTPPCTKKIIDYKFINKVVYGVDDIDHRTSTKAQKILKLKNIKVKKNICKKDILNFYKKYFFFKKKKLPFVTGKIACSKDNYIKKYNNKYITNSSLLEVSHLLRFRNEGILISYKTLNADNPKLNCRINGLEKYSPKIFILDKNLNSKKNSNIFKNNKKNKIFMFYNSNNRKKINFFIKKKVNLIKISTDKNNKFNLRLILSKIYNLKISSLLVEGGKILTESFIENKLFNDFYLFKSNKKLGDTGYLSISGIINKVSSIFKNQRLLDTYTNKDKIIKYF